MIEILKSLRFITKKLSDLVDKEDRAEKKT